MKNYKKKIKKRKRVLIDMTCSLIHHGHVRLIKKASRFGEVFIALTIDKEIKKHKKITPELKFNHRKEILESINNVKKVIPSKFKITQNFLNKNNINVLVQGSDYINRKFITKAITFPRTKNISSTKIRKIAAKNI